jgi:hypothetical protein
MAFRPKQDVTEVTEVGFEQNIRPLPSHEKKANSFQNSPSNSVRLSVVQSLFNPPNPTRKLSIKFPANKLAF